MPGQLLVVCRQLEHADPSITLRVYGELFEDGLDEAAATLYEGFSDVVGLHGEDAKKEPFTR